MVGIRDPDRQMLDGAIEIAAQRQPSHRRPPGCRDHRDLLREQKPKILLIGSPDHWHALHAIDAIEAGADVDLQKPISRDVLEGDAILAAARRHGRVVQIGPQRKSTPHLIEAKQTIVGAGRLATIGHVDMCGYVPIEPTATHPSAPCRSFLITSSGRGRHRCARTTGYRTGAGGAHSWSMATAIVGDMCVPMLDPACWMRKLGWPKRISSIGGIFVPTGGTSNITDTQTVTFDYDGLSLVWQHRTGGPPAAPDYPWALVIYGEKDVLKASTMRADFLPWDKSAKPIHLERLYEREQYPEDLAEKTIELNAAPATRRVRGGSALSGWTKRAMGAPVPDVGRVRGVGAVLRSPRAGATAAGGRDCPGRAARFATMSPGPLTVRCTPPAALRTSCAH